jgi:Membrane bound beta barrel domain (DUF5777)
MKPKLNIQTRRFILPICLVCSLLLLHTNIKAQDSTAVAEEPTVPAKAKPVKNTFQSVWIIDNQTVMVPVKGTLEMDIMHRFGKVEKGYEDLAGFFAPSNIRLDVSYAPVKNLFVGIGLTKEHMLWDASAKYSIITQTKGKYPVSATYYGNMAYDTRKDPDGSLFKYEGHRLSFFNQLIIARKITDKFSVQVAPSHSHQNFVKGYYTKNDSTGKDVFKEMKHEHFAIAVSARYKLTNVTSVMINYDQPITKHAINNPNPNLSFGVEFNTSSHSFQLFMGNFSSLSPQLNNLYNHSDPFSHETNGGKYNTVNLHFLNNFRIGFNITRLWNY